MTLSFVCHRVEERGEGAFTARLEVAAQAGTDLLCVTSWRQGQGRAQMGGKLQATLQPLAPPPLAARLRSSVTPCLCLPPLRPFVSFALELCLPPAAWAGAVPAAPITPSSAPQLKQWKAFEEESQTVSHMAKYFTSPSRSCRSVYSEEQLYQLIGEKNSMKRLLTEVGGSAGPPQPCWLLPFPFVG